MSCLGADRNLLFGILALQLEFIRSEQLIAAMNRWLLQKSTPLGEILVRDGQLTAERSQLLEALVQEHLRQHADDPEQSLASVSSLGSVRHLLEQLGDPDVNASLARVPAGRTDVAPASPAREAAGVSQRFRILRPHARGGLGQISVACDEELHREVALKELRQHLADDADSRVRFVREAEITGNLEHPGVVPVYGLGQYADGRPFYAMRFIHGDSLDEAIEQYHRSGASQDMSERGSLELRKLLGRFIDVCNAVAYAHSRGVLHRDLKPGNIMLGKYGETLVVDWGLAKPTGQREGRKDSGEKTFRPQSVDSSEPTRLGSAVGTPAFMSPEQAAGRIDDLGVACDVYSLGATLYCLLTGRAPITDCNMTVALDRVQTGDFPRPRAVKSGIPVALEAICLKAMALEPASRYGTPSLLAEDIEHWLADEPVTACRDPLGVRLRRWSRHHRTAVASLAVTLLAAVVAVCIGAILLGEANRRIQTQRDAANRNAAEARRQRDLANLSTAEAFQGRGLSRLAEGDHVAGMHWLARSLKSIPHTAGDVERVSRQNLAAWSNSMVSVAVERAVPRLLDFDQLSDQGPVGMVLVAEDAPAEKTSGGRGDPTVLLPQMDDIEGAASLQLLHAKTLDFAGPPLKPDGQWWGPAFEANQDVLLTCDLVEETQMDLPSVSDPSRATPAQLAVLSSLGEQGQAALLRGMVLLRRRKLPTGEPERTPLRLTGTFIRFDHERRFQPSIMYHAGSDLVLTFDYASAAAQPWSWSSGKPVCEPIPCVRAEVSENGKTWATAGADHVVTVRDASGSREIGKPLRHEAAVQQLCFNRDGTLLAIATEDNRVHVWDAHGGIKLTTIEHKLGRLRSIETRTQEDAWLLINDFGSVELWKLDPPARGSQPSGERTAAERRCQLVRHEDMDLSMAEARFACAGKWLLLSDMKRAVIFREELSPNGVMNYREVFSVSGDISRKSVIAIHESSQRFAGVAADGHVRLFSESDALVLRHARPAIAARFSGTGETLATCDELGVIRLWDARRGALNGMTFGVDPAETRSLIAVSQAGDFVAAVDMPKAASSLGKAIMRLWKTPSGETAAREIDARGQTVFALAPRDNVIATTGIMQCAPAFSLDGKRMAVVDSEGKVRCIEASTGRLSRAPLQTSSEPEDIPPTELVWTPDSKRIVVIRHGRKEGNSSALGQGPLRAQLWDVAAGNAAGPLIRVEDASGAIALNKNCTRLAIGAEWPIDDLRGQLEGGEIRFHIWDLTTGKPVVRDLSHRGKINSLAFTPDGSILASASSDQSACLWDARNGKRLCKPIKHEGDITQVFVLANGSVLLTVGDDAWQTWNVTSGRPVLPPVRLGYSGGLSAAVSHDGRRLATVGLVSEAGSLQEWDTATGRPVGPLQAVDARVHRIGYDASSRNLVVEMGENLRVFPVFDQLEGSAEKVQLWVETITGTEMDELGGLHSLSTRELDSRRRRLADLGGVQMQRGPRLEVWACGEVEKLGPGHWPPRLTD
jgi:serine/threonine protein kinase/WD40 repeat protein